MHIIINIIWLISAQLDIPPECDSSHATQCQEEGTSGQMHEIGSESQCSEPTKQNIGCAIVQNELREICNAGEQSNSLSENVTENSHLEQLGLPSEDVSKSSQSGAENVFAKQGYQSISGYKQDESLQTTAVVFSLYYEGPTAIIFWKREREFSY